MLSTLFVKDFAIVSAVELQLEGQRPDVGVEGQPRGVLLGEHAARRQGREGAVVGQADHPPRP